MSKITSVVLGLSAVIVAVFDDHPRVFIVRGAEHDLSAAADTSREDGDALPFGPFDPVHHETLEKGLRSWVESQTPLTPAMSNSFIPLVIKNAMQVSMKKAPV